MPRKGFATYKRREESPARKKNTYNRGKGMKKMEKMEIGLGEMEQVTGGTQRVVNTGIDDIKAAIRLGPSKGSKQIASLASGTIVDTVSDELVYDSVAGRNFVEIVFTDRNGVQQKGWIAASIVGMKR